MATRRFTKKEKIVVLTEALRLLRKPESWIKGEWKCQITKFRKNDRYWAAEAVLDSKGRPQFAYCLEGAVNQAIINKLGEKRAEKLGVYDSAKGPAEWEWEWTDKKGEPRLVTEQAFETSFPTAEISVLDLLLAEGKVQHTIYEKPGANWFNDAQETTHKDVLGVLRRRRAQLQKEMQK